MTIRIAIHGATGRMGRDVAKLVIDSDDLLLVSAITKNNSKDLGKDISAVVGGCHKGVNLTSNLKNGLADADLVIDFSTSAAAIKLLEECCDQRLPAIVGTTGLDVIGDQAINRLAEVAAVVASPNMSVAITILFSLVSIAAKLLGPEFDAEIIDIHHRNKIDSPSGTAVRLASAVAAAKHLNPDQAVVSGRNGLSGPRPQAEIGVHALRTGDVVGDHTVMLAGPGERLELTHRAHDRIIFAKGALRAARWIIGRPPGRYDMADVIGISR